MNTEIIKIDKVKFETKELEEAINILRRGGLVAFPTETVYGLGANALNEEAARKIYAAKGRPSDNPLIIHIADKDALNELASEIPKVAENLVEAFWPGPLTIIFKKSDKVPMSTTGGLDTVAIRMPEEPISLALIKESGVYIAAPSANTSGRPSPTKAEHVMDDLNGKIDMIIDGGPVGIGLESTIVDVTSDIPTILRPGFITKDMLETVIGEVEIDQAILDSESDIKPKAPGMKYKHYAPKGDITIFEGNLEDVISQINKKAKENVLNGIKVGIIATDETVHSYNYGIIKSIGTRKDNTSIARSMFALLREFDDLEVEYIYTESFRDAGLGQAIMNRLLKAAGHHVINA
ncbi:L-threonylcarbamoyladenylate synthase [Mobilisporobacter senegalensis]|uniref:Threonylcarbamoyl-AMP synthase n=1 Tax=Mobilisporobacter senegalensis TaxID=1329262 RepID=A0A3N1XHT4_9FIRM|nr:L-threonylcarbamoyladenylate synthase [Mobilisporobacter senegalensis]ROR25701.1 L-threonylcarbamoyladenylate synthase [Mobilisporobacter senegalensis]